MQLIVVALVCVACGWSRPRPSTIWTAALAWPLADWLRLFPDLTGFTSPRGLLVLPAALCALSAYAGVLLRRAHEARQASVRT